MAKLGRPKKATNERQSKQIAIRVTAAEYGKLKRAAGNTDISDYIRQGLGIRGEKMRMQPLTTRPEAVLNKKQILAILRFNKRQISKAIAALEKLASKAKAEAAAFEKGLRRRVKP
jgi:hypothetical protein